MTIEGAAGIMNPSSPKNLGVTRSPAERPVPTMSRQITLTENDLERLTRLLGPDGTRGGLDAASRERLEDEIAQARVVKPEEVPPDVVTIRSRVRARDVRTGAELVFSIVYPREADADQNRISVLAPLGAGLLGYRVGDTIDWPVPAGVRSLRIEEVLYQPEADGQFDA